GQDLKGRGVRLREQVGLDAAREALDRRAVEADPLGEGALDLGRGDRHRLQGADDIGEPQAHELDAALLDRAEDEVPLLVHAHSPRSSWSDAALQPSSAASSSAHAWARARRTSGAPAASSCESKGPTRSTLGEIRPNSTSPLARLYQY